MGKKPQSSNGRMSRSGKPRRVVRLLAWDDEARAGVVLVRSAGRKARFSLAFQEMLGMEPMVGWKLTCLCCAKVRYGAILTGSGAVECECACFERDGRCRHAAIIEQL